MLRDSIARCKALLPLPELWRRLALPGEPKKLCSSPFREDKHPSFSVFPRDGLWFWRDQARDESGDEIGFLMQQYRELSKDGAIDLYHELAGVELPRKSRKSSKQSLGKPVAFYDYFDADGRLVHQTVRYEPKRFLQRRPAAEGMRAGNKIAKRDRDGNWWLWTLQGIEPVLYRLPQLVATSGKPIVLCEGEKDADALAATGAITTTAAMGAGKWGQSYSEILRGRDVIIAADRDPIGSAEAGQNHAMLVAEHLRGYAKSVRVLDWSKLWPEAAADPTRKLDISLWLESRKEESAK